MERSIIERLLDRFVGGEEQKRNERKERGRRRREEEGNRTSVVQWSDPDRLGMELRYER